MKKQAAKRAEAGTALPCGSKSEDKPKQKQFIDYKKQV